MIRHARRRIATWCRHLARRIDPDVRRTSGTSPGVVTVNIRADASKLQNALRNASMSVGRWP